MVKTLAMWCIYHSYVHFYITSAFYKGKALLASSSWSMFYKRKLLKLGQWNTEICWNKVFTVSPILKRLTWTEKITYLRNDILTTKAFSSHVRCPQGPSVSSSILCQFRESNNVYIEVAKFPLDIFWLDRTKHKAS